MTAVGEAIVVRSRDRIFRARRGWQMDAKRAVESLVREVREYAAGRASDVARGAETPRLAALLLQKYGLGVAKAVAVIYDSPRVADLVVAVLGEETAKIDPDWREHDRERWDARPADVAIRR